MSNEADFLNVEAETDLKPKAEEARKPTKGDPLQEFLGALNAPRATDPMSPTEDRVAVEARRYFKAFKDAGLIQQGAMGATDFARSVRAASKEKSPLDLMREIREEIK